MTPVDDLKVGMYVAITEYRAEPEPVNPFFGFGCQQPSPRFDGKPWRIVAISLPFVCLTDGRGKAAIDLRLWGLQKINRQYAMAFEAGEPATPIKFAKRKKKTKPDQKACPRCGAKMVERLRVPGKSIWAPLCKQCGYDSQQITVTKP